MADKIFISYSHEDKAFAERLAQSLTNDGVPVFWDKWDIAPGDSLVERIFEEGLKDCGVFVVILSQASVKSRWVREELSVATLQRMQGATRVVPVLKETCDIPNALVSLRWIDLRNDFAQGIRELVMLSHNVRERPTVGRTPDYITKIKRSVGGLSTEASTVGTAMIMLLKDDAGRGRQFRGQELTDVTSLTPLEISDAVDELEQAGLAQTYRTFGSGSFSFSSVIPTYALHRHFREVLDYDPDEDVKRVLVAVANEDQVDNKSLLSKTALPVDRLNRAVKYVEEYGLARVLTYLGTAPFSFGTVMPTSSTRRAVKDFAG